MLRSGNSNVYSGSCRTVRELRSISKSDHCLTLCLLLQVTLPLVSLEGCPVGLSLIGPKGSDEQLLEVTEKLMGILA